MSIACDLKAALEERFDRMLREHAWVEDLLIIARAMKVVADLSKGACDLHPPPIGPERRD